MGVCKLKEKRFSFEMGKDAVVCCAANCNYYTRRKTKMPNALLYTQSGGGKTVNSTLVAAPKRGKNLLICTDNSSIVLRKFKRPNLEIKNVASVK